MIRKIAIVYLLFAGWVFAAGDPYAGLSKWDFGQPGDIIAAITQEVETAKPEARAAIEAKLLQAAQAPEATFACQSFVSEMLRVIGSPACVPVVVKWLGDPKTADLATQALQGMKASEVTQALLKAIPKARGNVKLDLIQAVADRRENAALPALEKLAAGRSPETARAALAAMGSLATPEAVAVLRKLPANKRLDAAREQALLDCAFAFLKDSKADAAREIVTPLLKSPRASVACAALTAAVQLDGEKALPLVVETLKDKRTDVAVRAAYAGRGLKSPEATTALAAALPELRSAAVKTALLRTLRERGDKAAFPAVQAQLRSRTPDIKCEAIRACETLGDASVVPSLIRLAPGTDEPAAAARDTLARLKQPGVDQRLIRQLGDPKPEVVSAAAAVLVARGCLDAKPRLLELAADSDPAIRKAALGALDSFVGTQDVPALMRLLAKAEPADRNRIAQVIWSARRGEGKKDQRFMAIWKVAPEGDKTARVALMSLAGQAGGEAPLEAVRPFLQDGDPKVREQACRTLFAWSDESAAQETLNVLKTTDNLTLRVLAARSLANRLTDRKAKLPKTRREAMLKEALEKLERPEDKQIVQWAIEKLNEPQK